MPYTITRDSIINSPELLYCSSVNCVPVELPDGNIAYEICGDNDKSVLGGYICPGGGGIEKMFSLGMEPGKSYTASVDVEVIAPYKPPHGIDVPKIAVDIFIDGKQKNDFANSTSAPNLTCGVKFHLCCAFTLPNAEGARIRLQLGAIKDKGTVRFSNFKLEDGLIPDNRNAIFKNYKNSFYDQLQESDGCFKTNPDQGKKLFCTAVENSGNQMKIDIDDFWNQFKGQVLIKYRMFNWVFDNLETIKLMSKHSPRSNADLGYLPVFSCWLQGRNNAPALMKSFFNRMEDCTPKGKFHVIEDEQSQYWIEIPDRLRKIKNSNPAFYVDFVRTALLERYGGIWLDSTAYVSRDFYIKSLVAAKNGVFFYNYSKYAVSSWYIVALRNNVELLRMLKNAIILYFEQNDNINEYFMYHCMVVSLLDFCPELRTDFSPMIPNLTYHDVVLPSTHRFYDIPKDKFMAILEKAPAVKFMFKKHDYKKFSLDSIVAQAIRGEL